MTKELPSLFPCRHPSSTNGLCDACGGPDPKVMGMLDHVTEAFAIQNATVGHPDDPKTAFAWAIALHEITETLSDLLLFQYEPRLGDESWRGVAAALDGLDGQALADRCRAAYEELRLYRDALRARIAEYEDVTS